MRASYALLLLIVSTVAFADDNSYEFGGHSKLRLLAQSYPDDSLFRDLAGASSVDTAGELRLNFSAKNDKWSLHADYQLIALNSEFIALGLPDDNSRLFDLTNFLKDGNDNAILHRLDRLWVGYTGEKTVVRFGRLALSWGNGLIYTPMDFFNPFDPSAIEIRMRPPLIRQDLAHFAVLDAADFLGHFIADRVHAANMPGPTSISTDDLDRIGTISAHNLVTNRWVDVFTRLSDVRHSIETRLTKEASKLLGINEGSI